MFKCESCKETQPPKIKPHRVVLQKRKVTYNNGGRGWEIIKEANICDECYNDSPFVATD